MTSERAGYVRTTTTEQREETVMPKRYRKKPVEIEAAHHNEGEGRDLDWGGVILSIVDVLA